MAVGGKPTLARLQSRHRMQSMAHAFSRLGSAFSGSSSTSSYNSGDVDIGIDMTVEEGIFAAGDSHSALACFSLQQLLKRAVHGSYTSIGFAVFQMSFIYSYNSGDISMGMNIEDATLMAGELKANLELHCWHLSIWVQHLMQLGCA